MLKILIVEDEVAAARRLQRLLTETGIRHALLAHLESVEDTVRYLRYGNAPDLILMDIHLADGSCFNIFKQIELQTPVIFTTAYDQYAINAFKVNSIDYLLKPIGLEDLKLALNKYLDRRPEFELLQRIKMLSNTHQTHQQRFVVKSGHSLKVVEVKEVAMFYAEDKMVIAFTFNQKQHLLDHSLDKLESLLDPAHFFRINRKVIVQTAAIKDMSLYFRGKLKLNLHVKPVFDLLVSAEKAESFKRWIENSSAQD